jgi:hypothetical protein
MLVRVRDANIREDIPFTSVAHGLISFAIRSASLSRRLTSSRSACGVARPVFDFF